MDHCFYICGSRSTSCIRGWSTLDSLSDLIPIYMYVLRWDHAVVPPKEYTNHAAIVDMGATGHYLDTTAEQYCTNTQHTNARPSIRVANSKNIDTTKRVLVPLAKELLTKAKVRHIFDSLQSGSLITIGQLCNNDCVALFTKYDVKIYKDGLVIIVGEHNETNSLWNIPLAPKPTLTPQPHGPLSKRCDQKRQNQARPHSFSTRLRIQSTTLHFPPCRPMWSLQTLARSDHDPHHQAPPSQITSN